MQRLSVVVSALFGADSAADCNRFQLRIRVALASVFGLLLLVIGVDFEWILRLFQGYIQLILGALCDGVNG